MIISTHPLADEELVAGAVHYAKEASARIAERFIAEFERSVQLMQEFPDIGAPWREPIRRLPIRRFPYSIVYYHSGEVLRILAIAHQKRKPGYWRGRD